MLKCIYNSFIILFNLILTILSYAEQESTRTHCKLIQFTKSEIQNLGKEPARVTQLIEHSSKMLRELRGLHNQEVKYP